MIKIKPRTIEAFRAWKLTHKMSDSFVWNGKPIKGSDFKKVLDGDAPKAEPKLTPLLEQSVNTDIEDLEHVDMERSGDRRDTEEH